MKVVCDIETNRLHDPDKIWCIVCKDVETKVTHTFENVHEKPQQFQEFAKDVDAWIGHNFLSFDAPVLNTLVGRNTININRVIDTLVVSRLLDYSRAGGHSLEQYGEEFGYPKVLGIDFNIFDDRMIERCTTDVEINYKLYEQQRPYIESPKWKDAMRLEHEIAVLCSTLSTNGFYFNYKDANSLLLDITTSLNTLDNTISNTFKPTTSILREVVPVVTSYGTLHKKDFRGESDLSIYNGGPFSRFEWKEFNAGSPRQLVEVLNKAGWQPTEKTKGHIELERELERLRGVDIEKHPKYSKLIEYKRYGWKVNEANLATLPENAPEPARMLAKRILLESRRKTLQEWVDNYNPSDGRIHGQFHSIGAWTHRMSHTAPNTANIPREEKEYGAEMRSFWTVPEGSYLVGVDAEGIQLRVLAHYIDDKDFTHSLEYGDKSKGTDPHTFNQNVIGPVCKSRQKAKRFIYALLLGAGLDKLAEILECTKAEAKQALANIIQRYEGWQKLKEEIIPRDAAKGYFEGLDGRFIKIWGDEDGLRRHLAMSGYLQSGEAIVMKRACVEWHKQLTEEKIPFKLVNFVHDEWQTEVNADYDTALHVANVMAASLKKVGEDLNLKCPMAGSILNQHDVVAIGKNWNETH